MLISTEQLKSFSMLLCMLAKIYFYRLASKHKYFHLPSYQVDLIVSLNICLFSNIIFTQKDYKSIFFIPFWSISYPGKQPLLGTVYNWTKRSPTWWQTMEITQLLHISCITRKYLLTMLEWKFPWRCAVSTNAVQIGAVCQWSSALPFFPCLIFQLDGQLDHRRIMLCVFYLFLFYLFYSFYYGYTDIYTLQIKNMPPI